MLPAPKNSGNGVQRKSIQREAIKVLIADDDLSNRLVLERVLDEQGYQIVIAENGQQAVELFKREHPDLVLMDVTMPVMDGYTATTIIKDYCNDRFVPIIFLTAVTEEEGLVSCINSGGDDFLTKPFNDTILNAKIDALLRIRQLYNTINQQKNEIKHYHQRIESELIVASSLFAKILNPGSLSRPNIKYITSPMSLFNGDILIAADKPTGGLHVLIGDFIGHGLGAATGALPAASIFYEMTKKGYTIVEIVAEINEKLNSILPTGMFMAACAVDVDARGATVSIWNGGIPDALLYNGTQGKITRRIASNNLPLGIVNSIRFDSGLQTIHVSDQDKLYLYTDGVIETTDRNNIMFGQGRLEEIFFNSENANDIFETINNKLDNFREGKEQTDDVTLLELSFDRRYLSQAKKQNQKQSSTSHPSSHWSFIFDFGVDMIKTRDPVSVILHCLTELQGLRDHRQKIQTIVAELYYNALEHGLLGLDTAENQHMEDCSRYYREREKRLAEIKEGYIKLYATHEPYRVGGKLTLRVEDSGIGFDYQRVQMASHQQDEHNSKGLPLLKKICQSVEVIGRGNIVEVLYVW